MQRPSPDPLSRYQGAHLTLKGDWDGQFLHLSDPKAAVALSPKPAAPPGEISVSGILTAPEGKRTPGGFDYAS